MIQQKNNTYTQLARFARSRLLVPLLDQSQRLVAAPNPSKKLLLSYCFLYILHLEQFFLLEYPAITS